MRTIVLSDLDGALLDARTGSFDDARPALEELKKRKIPLVLVTSKTREEVLALQKQLGIREPFVVESGGGIYLPKGAFAALPKKPVAVERGDLLLLPLSAGIEEVRAGFEHLRTFTEDSIREVPRDAEFTVSFTFERKEEAFAPYLAKKTKDLKLRVTRSGSTYHLHGDADPARAVEVLKKLYGGVRTVAVGVTETDLPLLLDADVAVVLLKPDGTHDATLMTNVPKARRIDAAGPSGWSKGVLEALGPQ